MATYRQAIEKQALAPVFGPMAESNFPAVAGAYALLIRLSRPLRAEIGALGPVDLPAGTYLYLGSANGPGGLRARLRRHLRADKKPHWHVDALTRQGEIAAVLAVPGGQECDLVARALNQPGVTIPHPGFGSSDCRRCKAHLLAVPGNDRTIFKALRRVAGAIRLAPEALNSV